MSRRFKLAAVHCIVAAGCIAAARPIYRDSSENHPVFEKAGRVSVKIERANGGTPVLSITNDAGLSLIRVPIGGWSLKLSAWEVAASRYQVLHIDGWSNPIILAVAREVAASHCDYIAALVTEVDGEITDVTPKDPFGITYAGGYAIEAGAGPEQMRLVIFQWISPDPDPGAGGVRRDTVDVHEYQFSKATKRFELVSNYRTGKEDRKIRALHNLLYDFKGFGC